VRTARKIVSGGSVKAEAGFVEKYPRELKTRKGIELAAA
jgi:hypothetical protein